MKTRKKKVILKMLSVFLVCGYVFGGRTIYLEAASGSYASNPSPADGAIDVPVETNLTWTRGKGALEEEVYFGTDPCALPKVADITDLETNPPLYNPGDPNLVASTTYYWQIVEVNGLNRYEGHIWEFTTIRGEAQCYYPEDGAVIPGDIVSGKIVTELIFIPGPTAVEHTGYFSKVRDEVESRADVAKIPTPWIPIPGFKYKFIVGGPWFFPYERLIRGQVYYWIVDSNDSFGNTFSGDVWEFTIQDFKAFEPSPPNEALLISTTPLLSWLPGFSVEKHDIYMGTSWEDVNNAEYDHYNQPPEYVITRSDPNYQVVYPLPYNTKIYWRVDEVVSRGPPDFIPLEFYKGDVWSFTTVPPVAKTYHVDGVNGDNTNDGLTRETAFETIQFAIDKANDGDTVLVWPGVYNEAATQGINFKGKGITVKSAADAAVLEVPGFVAVTFVQGEDENSILSNFVLRGSTTGIFALFANPTISNVTVVDNENGVMADNADPEITNCIFWNNTNGDLFGSPDPIEAKYSWFEGDVNEPNIPPAGLISHWKFDEGGGLIAYDSAGNNDAVVFGATWTTSPFGNALDFDGTDDYVDCGSTFESVTSSSTKTIMGWAKSDVVSYATHGGRIVSLYKDSATTGFAIFADGDPATWKGRYRKTGDAPQSLDSGIPVTMAQWTHVALVQNGADIYLYINGAMNNSASDAIFTPISSPPNVSVGAYVDFVEIKHQFNGLIDEVAIYNRALSVGEIEQIYEPVPNPLFADAAGGDYHLKSERGRYWPAHDVWVLDDETSPCIDGGDPEVDPSNERMPNGGRINMGAYGNTVYASMSECRGRADINCDGIVNFKDLAILAQFWLEN